METSQYLPDFEQLKALSARVTSPQLLVTLTDHQNVVPIFELIETEQGRKLLSKLAWNASDEALKSEIKVEIIDGKKKFSSIPIPNYEPRIALSKFLETQFRWTPIVLEELFSILEIAIGQVTMPSELDALIERMSIIAAVSSQTFGDIEIYSRKDKTHRIAELKKEELKNKGVDQVKANVNEKTAVVTQLESGQVPTFELLVRLFKDHVSETEMSQVGGAENLAESTLYLATMAVESPDKFRATFDRRAVIAIVGQSQEVVNPMIAIWIRLGIIKIQPKELASKSEQFYVATPELSQALEHLLD